MKRMIPGVAMGLLAACAPMTDANNDGIVDGVRTPDTVSQIAPSTPVGSVSGMVVNTLYAPIEGVQVVMVLGKGEGDTRTITKTTNGAGVYTFGNVPAGSFAQLVLSKTGYSSARVNSSVPSSAGNFPLNDGNGNAGVVALAQLNGTLKFRVYTAQGKPAKGAKAFLEVGTTAFQAFSGSYGASVGNFSAAADVDENGLLTFSGAPDPAELARINSNFFFNLTIGALDEDNDGRTDALGTIQQYTAGALFTQPDRTIVLGDARSNATLAIVATNLDSFASSFSAPYRNALKANDPITVVFNQPITQVGSTQVVRVVQEDCMTNVPISITQRAPNVLSIAPTGGWTLGNRYNIVVRATGLDSGVTTDFIGYFFAIDPTAPRPLSPTAAFQVRKAMSNTMSNALQPGDSLNVVFDTPITAQGGPSAYALVNFDLNGDNITGGPTGFGEFNGPVGSGFSFNMSEQTTANDPALGTFSCRRSGYSSRWEIRITSFPGTGFIPASTGMRVTFPKDQVNSDTYQTAWGSPVATDVNGTINIVP